MKKSLIALAVLGFAGTAMAQSSVTLYGVADAGIARTQGYVTTVDPDGIETTSKKSSTHFQGGGLMVNGTSRIGVRGVEDLGGGLKVGFNFESGLNLGNGAQSDANFWARAANLWIGGNWGTLTMGRQLNPSFWGVAAYELTGTANYSVIANTFGWGADHHRHSSMFAYKTPNMGGFTASLGYILKDDATVLAPSGEGYQGAKWDLNAIYANGPLAVALSANKAKDEKTGYALGGKYNFGSFVVSASYHNSREYRQRRGFAVGGTANLGAFAVTLDLTRTTKDFTGAKKYTNGLLEGKYALSKRTFAYAAYLRLQGLNNFGIGLRHNF